MEATIQVHLETYGPPWIAVDEHGNTLQGIVYQFVQWCDRCGKDFKIGCFAYDSNGEQFARYCSHCVVFA